MELWGRACTFVGYATAWAFFPNPVAALGIALGSVARWAMITHHVMHRAYDRVPGVPPRFTSKVYARGWRRFVDWLDWVHPEAWAHEHNTLHHYHTGELDDPDLVEHNLWPLRKSWLPLPVKLLVLAVVVPLWRLVYYAPNTFWAWRQHVEGRARPTGRADGSGGAGGAGGRGAPHETAATAWRFAYPGERVLVPVTPRAWHFHLRCVAPYALVRFGLLPALFLPLGREAWLAVLVNSLLAEAIAGLHSFAIIVPNHAGDDLYRFDRPVTDKAEFYVRQVVGSVNYPGGTDLRDFLCGFLNYQIEHHVWPDLPMLKLREAAPQLRAICQRHGVPYVEQPLARRLWQLGKIMVGAASMRRVVTSSAAERRALAAAGAGAPVAAQRAA